ncbi:MAG: AgmX/PglI C-terminal domain-containing protein [Pseudomonadota bacterium]|nr:AgmX/PglI C-terminal domain-containing protein [Pseudomonadota bacterium]
MRVVCDNCGASYKIPDSKLTKEVNKATCRKCGHAIFIKRVGEEEARPAAAAPSPYGEERTLITSAADLERAVRSRSGSGFDEPADQRPTTVSLDNHGEATVPREPLAPAAPPSAFVPGSPAFPPAPALARPSLQKNAPPPTPPRAPPQAPGRPPAPLISPSAELAAFPPPPRPTLAPSPQAAPPLAGPQDPNAPAAPVGAFDPRTDLSMALVALLVTVLGVLVLALSSWFQSPIVTGLGAFLALLGTFVVALILVTGGRGTRAASLAISFLGGLMLSGAFGATVGVGLYFVTPPPALLPTPPVQVAALTPPAPVVVPVPAPAPVPVEVAPAEVVPVAVVPVEPPAVVTPAPVAPPAATTPPPAASKPVSTTTTAAAKPVSKPATTSTASTSKTTTPKATTTTSDAPERITPKTTSTSSSGKSTSGTSTASTAAAASSGVSPMVIDTMIKSNKGVKSCFVQQRNETGELPKGVKVKLSIQPSGKVSSAGLPSGDLQGSTFDSCLSSAVKSIQFPSFDGDPVTVTYPFSI